MPSDALEGVALVTGGGRGIGASIARELADAGHARGRHRADGRAGRGGRGRDRRPRAGRRREPRRATSSDWVAAPRTSSARSTSSSRTRASATPRAPSWEIPVDAWWHVLEVNVLGVHLSCRAVIPGMLERGRGRIVITGSGAAYLPGSPAHRVPGEQGGRLPVRRDARRRARGRGSRSSSSAPGSSGRSMTGAASGTTLPWTPPELAPQLVRVLASGRADALAGRYLHAEHDDIEDLIGRADEIAANDLNAIRLRR